MTNYYDVSIAARVEPFLAEAPSNRWYTVGAIAISTHLEHWQVEQQLAPLVSSGKVAVEEGRLYRWDALAERGAK